VPYSSPMFDVPDVSRFYRCSITDVHIGRSLISAISVPTCSASGSQLQCRISPH